MKNLFQVIVITMDVLGRNREVSREEPEKDEGGHTRGRTETYVTKE